MKEGKMKKLVIVTILFVFLLTMGDIANATNGDNLIGIGPIARVMGGVGIAAPQDSISAVFANPAAMCFGPYCPGSQVDFAGTIFLPTAHGKVEAPGFGVNAGDRSQSNIFIVPAIGLSTPITPTLRFGIAAYGTSGLGVDYRDRLNISPLPSGDLFTQYQVMKFAPNLSYMIFDNLSVGLNVQLDYAALDLGQGTSSGYAVGVQLGAIYKVGPVSLGLSYVTPQTVNHKRVFDFDGNGIKDGLKLEMPQTLGFGIGFSPLSNLLIEGNFKWIDWSDAKGYEDFDWRDQYVFSLGAQYKPIPRLSLRTGFNYGRNPVKKHNGFNAASTATTMIQGKAVNTFQYEFLRIVGFPAVVETHLTFGIGYEFSEKFAINLGYAHGFEKKISETDSSGQFTLSSKLKEDSIELGLSWRF